MPLLIYILAALPMLWLAHRSIRPLSRGAAAYLFFLPFLFVGPALVRGHVYAPVDKIYMDVPLSELKGEYRVGPSCPCGSWSDRRS